MVNSPSYRNLYITTPICGSLIYSDTSPSRVDVYSVSVSIYHYNVHFSLHNPTVCMMLSSSMIWKIVHHLAGAPLNPLLFFFVVVVRGGRAKKPAETPRMPASFVLSCNTTSHHARITIYSVKMKSSHNISLLRNTNKIAVFYKFGNARNLFLPSVVLVGDVRKSFAWWRGIARFFVAFAWLWSQPLDRHWCMKVWWQFFLLKHQLRLFQ